MADTKPGPGDLILHACGGRPRFWLTGGTGRFSLRMRCECGAVVAPDQPPRKGHAQVFCGSCEKWVGLCSDSDPVAEAESVLTSTREPSHA